MAFNDDKSSGRGRSVVALGGGRAPVFRLDRYAKRLFDVAAATMGLVLFSPLLLITSIAIKLELARANSRPRDPLRIQEPTNTSPGISIGGGLRSK